MRKTKHVAPIVWMTGLPGSGKTTIAQGVVDKLHEDKYICAFLDGDRMREHICKGLGFSEGDRLENAYRIWKLSKKIARNNIPVIVATISPCEKLRSHIKKKTPGLIIVHVACSLETCVARDPKGLYKSALTGQTLNFTGISAPYDVPQYPDLILATEFNSVEMNVKKLYSLVKERTYEQCRLD